MCAECNYMAKKFVPGIVVPSTCHFKIERSGVSFFARKTIFDSMASKGIQLTYSTCENSTYNNTNSPLLIGTGIDNRRVLPYTHVQVL